MEFFAGLDVGGTSGRVKFLDKQGNEIGEYQGIGCAFNTEGPVLGRQKYTVLMKEAMGQYHLESVDCLGICVAASGIDSAALADSCREIFIDLGFAKDRLLVVNDCELFLYLSKGAAMVAISGTGSICFGRNDRGEVFRTGGWNHVLSDEGSSYDIGLQTLRAAAECLDGRIEHTMLLELVLKQTGIKNLDDADHFVNEHLMDKRTIGSLAGLCAEAAIEGDTCALQILKDCANKVYCLIADTYKKMDMDEKKADLWLWGSVVVKNEQYRNFLMQRISTHMPWLNVSIPKQTALDTAVETAKNIFSINHTL